MSFLRREKGKVSATRAIFVILVTIWALIPSRAALSAVPAAARELIVVADIDDTIRLTRIHPDGDFIQYGLGLLENRAFTGLAPLFSMLAARGAAFEYVSGTPKFLSRFPEHFLARTSFPPGALYDRQSESESIEDFKYRVILQLMKKNPDADFILLGDNGQRDVASYQKLQNNAEVASQIKMVLIHTIYRKELAMALVAGQKPFLTSAEIAFEFRLAGLINQNELKLILEYVLRGLQSDRLSTRDLTLPRFTPVTSEELTHLNELAQINGDPGAAELSSSIVAKIQVLKSVARSTAPAVGDSCRRVFIN